MQWSMHVVMERGAHVNNDIRPCLLAHLSILVAPLWNCMGLYGKIKQLDNGLNMLVGFWSSFEVFEFVLWFPPLPLFVPWICRWRYVFLE